MVHPLNRLSQGGPHVRAPRQDTCPGCRVLRLTWGLATPAPPLGNTASPASSPLPRPRLGDWVCSAREGVMLRTDTATKCGLGYVQEREGGGGGGRTKEERERAVPSGFIGSRLQILLLLLFSAGLWWILKQVRAWLILLFFNLIYLFLLIYYIIFKLINLFLFYKNLY